MLIDVSYFTKGPRHITNTSLGKVPNANAVEVNAAIEDYIAFYQEDFLTAILGESVGNKVNAYLVCQDEGDAVKNEHFDDICTRLRESFADYVFFKILGESNTQSTITGLVLLKSANSYVAPIERQVVVWNRMVKRNLAFVQWSSSPECPISGISTSSNLLKRINSLNL